MEKQNKTFRGRALLIKVLSLARNKISFPHKLSGLLNITLLLHFRPFFLSCFNIEYILQLSSLRRISRDSVGGILTRYGIESQWWRVFSQPSVPDNEPPLQWRTVRSINHTLPSRSKERIYLPLLPSVPSWKFIFLTNLK
jgi:hypothetical protein